ncbi:MAG: hypothetical protein LBB64_06530, partial [Dysgonamonadaceae bacterium]|nr:hypothetical protein [Dysgonamonadaceae bacterium]
KIIIDCGTEDFFYTVNKNLFQKVGFLHCEEAKQTRTLFINGLLRANRPRNDGFAILDIASRFRNFSANACNFQKFILPLPPDSIENK